MSRWSALSDGSVPRKTLCLSQHLPSGVPGATRPVIGPLGASSPLFLPHHQQGSPTTLKLASKYDLTTMSYPAAHHLR